MNKNIIVRTQMFDPPPRYKYLDDEEEAKESNMDNVLFLRGDPPSSRRRSSKRKALGLLSLLVLLFMFGTLSLMLLKAQDSLDDSIHQNKGIFERIRSLLRTLGRNKEGKKEENPCTLRPDPGPCRGLLPLFYYNGASGTCKEFYYGGCEGNGNRFMDKGLCLATCANEEGSKKKGSNKKEEPEGGAGIVPEVCQPPPASGPCRSLITRYYFDSKKLVCTMFYYGGCNGNSNNFGTMQECSRVCEHPNPRIIQVDPPQF